MAATFLSLEDISEESLEHSRKFCENAEIFTDSSGISNADKWGFVQSVFDDNTTLFSDIDFDHLYMSGDHLACEAGALIADLRTRYLQVQMLSHDPGDFVAHAMWMQNRCWQSKLREQANLRAYERASTIHARLT